MLRFWFLAILAVYLSLLATVSTARTQPVHLTGTSMGTYYSIKYLPDDQTPSSEKIHAGIAQTLEEINAQMSTYRPDSEISRFNASRKTNVPFPVSPDVITVINEAIRLHRLTEGALDITVGPLVNLWGFGPEARPKYTPDAAKIKARRALVGIDKLAVKGNALIKKAPGLSLDLSAIAKGYGVDRVAAYLESQKLHDYMVDIGGEIRARGTNAQKQPWQIAIEKPVTTLDRDVQHIVALSDQAMATSGDYRNYFEENGTRYSHTIDPRTGRPIQHRLVSVSVLDASCMTADGLATGLNVLGPTEAMRIANALNLPVLMIVSTDNGFETHYSKTFPAQKKAASHETGRQP